MGPGMPTRKLWVHAVQRAKYVTVGGKPCDYHVRHVKVFSYTLQYALMWYALKDPR